jgi:hypothetical protein
VKMLPQGTQVVATQAELIKTGDGLILGVSDQTKDTVLVVVESVGPDCVRGYKEGQILLVHSMNHAYFRGGVYHRVFFDEKIVMAVIEDLPLDQLEIHGVGARRAASLIQPVGARA